MRRTHQSRTHTGPDIKIYTIGKHEGAQQQLQLPVRHIAHATDTVTRPCASCHAFLASLAKVPAVSSDLAALE